MSRSRLEKKTAYVGTSYADDTLFTKSFLDRQDKAAEFYAAIESSWKQLKASREHIVGQPTLTCPDLGMK